MKIESAKKKIRWCEDNIAKCNEKIRHYKKENKHAYYWIKKRAEFRRQKDNAKRKLRYHTNNAMSNNNNHPTTPTNAAQPQQLNTSSPMKNSMPQANLFSPAATSMFSPAGNPPLSTGFLSPAVPRYVQVPTTPGGSVASVLSSASTRASLLSGRSAKSLKMGKADFKIFLEQKKNDALLYQARNQQVSSLIQMIADDSQSQHDSTMILYANVVPEDEDEETKVRYKGCVVIFILRYCLIALSPIAKIILVLNQTTAGTVYMEFEDVSGDGGNCLILCLQKFGLVSTLNNPLEYRNLMASWLQKFGPFVLYTMFQMWADEAIQTEVQRLLNQVRGAGTIDSFLEAAHFTCHSLVTKERIVVIRDTEVGLQIVCDTRDNINNVATLIRNGESARYQMPSGLCEGSQYIPDDPVHLLYWHRGGNPFPRTWTSDCNNANHYGRLQVVNNSAIQNLPKYLGGAQFQEP